MKKICFTVILLAVSFSMTAQNHAPGGVPKAYIWDIAQQGGFFDGSKNTFSVPLPSKKSNTFTVFVVYKHTQTGSEQTVWSVDGQSGTSLVMTTKRVGDLEQSGYINYAFENEPQYRIFTYTHNEPSNENKHAENLQFSLGNFKGFIPEIILYDRVLNPKERLRVESYLAIKYGISLSQVFPTSYLSSGGAIVWDGEKEKKFNQHITAIGRDDNSNLHQTSSTASREPELLRISLSQSSRLANDNFVFWANNGGGLHFAPRYGGWKQTAKVWKLQKTDDISGRSIVQDFDLSNLSNRYLGEDEHYALMIDHSGTGTFPVGEVSFVEAKQSGNKLRFSNIDWNKNDKQEVFSLVIIPKNFQYNDTNCLTCADNDSERDLLKGQTNFSNLHLYPNPTADGDFWLDLVLHQTADVDVKIYTISGVLISERKLRGSAYYLYKGNLPQVGSYVIQLISKGTTESLKIIRN
jgi:hypothetical protein